MAPTLLAEVPRGAQQGIMRANGSTINDLYRKQRQLRGRLLVVGAVLAAAVQIVGALCLSGCGGRTGRVHQNGGSTSDALPARLDSAPPWPSVGSGPRKLDGGPSIADGGAAPAGCTIAIRVDHCCTVAEPATLAAVAADPCLVPFLWVVPLPLQDVPQLCLDRWPEECQLLDCIWSWPPSRLPPSRLVELDGRGRCEWKSECTTSADCELAEDARRWGCGCICPAAYPKSMVQEDPCLQPIYMSVWPPPGCPEEDFCDERVICEPCDPLPADAPACEPSVGHPSLSVCTSR